MPRHKPETDKQIALRQGGTLNPCPQDVHHPLFQGSDLFDPDDMVQVKYEMLRQVHVDNQPVSQAAREFGFSRPSFYQANSSFAEAGLAGLAPLKRGPEGRPQTYAGSNGVPRGKAKAEPSLSFAQLAELAKQEFDVQVHPRSIERQLLREKTPLKSVSASLRRIAQPRSIRCRLRRTAAPGVDQAPRPGPSGIDTARCLRVDERLCRLQCIAAGQTRTQPKPNQSIPQGLHTEIVLILAGMLLHGYLEARA